MATTTPEDLIRPLAEALGFDDVIATRYGRRAGHYDGTIDGEFVWGKGKARSVAGVGLPLAASTWTPATRTPTATTTCRCCRSSGNPRAVNPDPRMVALADAASLAGGALRRAGRRAEVRRAGAPAACC